MADIKMLFALLILFCFIVWAAASGAGALGCSQANKEVLKSRHKLQNYRDLEILTFLQITLQVFII